MPSIRRKANQPNGESWAEFDDAALLERAKLERDAFAAFYDRYFEAVYGYCARRLSTREQAEDATSQVFLNLLKSLPTYRSESGTARSWVFSVAHNTVTDQFRRARPSSLIDSEVEMPSTEPGPEAIAIVRETSAEVRALVENLPEDQATVLQMRLAGLNDREIAFARGQSWTAVRSVVHRAKARIRANLERSGTYAGDEIG